MPKATKRTATKRAAKIAKAHASELPKLEVKPAARKAPGYKPPARGVARNPVASILLTLLIIGLAVYTLYFYHVGPFAQPKPPTTTHPKPAATHAVTPIPSPSPTFTAANSPCLKVVKQVTDTSAAPTGAAFNGITHTYSQPPAFSINVNKVYCAGINTTRGLILLELDPQIAPNTVDNFVFLAQHHFYDGLKFHRVVPGFVIQTGDPQGTGAGGPGYKFADEPVKGDYSEGCVAMANSGPNTNGSQFFICTANDAGKLQKAYNLFGHVVQGMNVALKIQGPGDDPSTKNIKPDVINHVIVVAAP